MFRPLPAATPGTPEERRQPGWGVLGDVLWVLVAVALAWLLVALIV